MYYLQYIVVYYSKNIPLSKLIVCRVCQSCGLHNFLYCLTQAGCIYSWNNVLAQIALNVLLVQVKYTCSLLDCKPSASLKTKLVKTGTASGLNNNLKIFYTV